MGIFGRADLAWSAGCLGIDHHKLTSRQLYAEMSFSILASGFRVETVNKKWQIFSEIFHNWNLDELFEKSNLVGCMTGGVALKDLRILEGALHIFNNKRKVNAILWNGTRLFLIESEGRWPQVRAGIYEDVDTLKQFIYIGDILKYHIARNIGIDTIKPDLHIKRIAEHYDLDPFEMAKDLSKHFKIPEHTVDTILWRYGERGLIEEFWMPKSDDFTHTTASNPF